MAEVSQGLGTEDGGSHGRWTHMGVVLGSSLGSCE